MKKVPIPGFKLKKHFSVYFKLYLIAHKEFAFGRTSHIMRMNILSSYLAGKNPDWHHAGYLTNAEAERRNKLYLKE